MEPLTQLYPVRIPVRNAIIGYAIAGTFCVFAIAIVVFWIAEFVTAVSGSLSWPAALLLSVLVLRCLMLAMRYLGQRRDS